MAAAVRELECDITLIGRRSGECCNNVIIPFKTKRFRMLFKRGFLFYAFFNIRLFFHLLFHRYDILVSNDLDTLLPNWLVSKLKRTPLVYDSHEYFTGVPEIQNRRLVKWVWKSIERIIFPRLKYVITVSDSIAELYEKEYKIRPLTVRNCSVKADNIFPYSRTEIGVNPDHLLLILQGTGINVDRGGEELIDAVNITEGVSLLIVGSGDMIDTLKRKVRSLDLNNRVRFFPKVPWEELLRYTRSADAGMSLDKNNNVNYLYSLPNKLFDYIAAGIPVVASDLPEIKKVIVENKCGVIVRNVNPENISEAFTKLLDNKAKLEELKRNAVKASGTINWKIENEKVKELYNSIIQ
ncbi:MAG TPA: glycosyltransferase family 4 protein [Bacteroidales bacterium]|nr:glycosyltransferase family 4 protein [Bacteroidales bacterium]